jgi:3-methyl-2-oxobutanoate hydroxymethyltransferase
VVTHVILQHKQNEGYRMKTTIKTLQTMKQAKQAITMLTAYDATMASIISTAGIDVILVGDSLGNVIQGHDTTVPVTVSEMAYHTRCVEAGNKGSFLIADMPFMSYATIEQALTNAAQLMQAGAMMMKLEGGQWLLPIISHLVERGIPVCAHLGLTPQSVHKLGGFSMQAKEQHCATQLLEDAAAIEKAGAQLLIVECIPPVLAAEVSQVLRIPVIGIGAGKQVDGQVLVLHDMLGLTESAPKFSQNFMQGATSIQQAIENYVSAVKAHQFPKGT